MSTRRSTKKKRAILYVDGFNLYYGIRGFTNPCVKWLNLESLGESFVDANTKLIEVKYFTAEIKFDEERDNRDSCRRQTAYIKALEAFCTKIKIIYGSFLYKDRRCQECKRVSRIPEEKRTDVNIASHLIQDAYEDNFDCAFLISGDSDLTMPIQIVKSLGKNVIVVFPPKRKSKELEKHASNLFHININMLRKHLLPSTFSKEGKKHQCPEEWV